MQKLPMLFFVFISWFVNSQNSISLYYQTGSYKINQKNNRLLTSVINKLNKKEKYNILIEASTDDVGNKKSNFALAEKRANSIVSFLKKKDTIFKNFKIINNGEISHNLSNGKGNPKDRKVSIKFYSTKTYFKELQVGEKIILQNLNFKTGKDILLKNSYQSLNKLISFLKKNLNINIEIAGHVCCNANILKPYNKPIQKLDEEQLSTRRAKFVYRYLVYKGINKDRLTYAGYGFQRPLVYPENSFEDMKKNKRVEIIITKI